MARRPRSGARNAAAGTSEPVSEPERAVEQAGDAAGAPDSGSVVNPADIGNAGGSDGGSDNAGSDAPRAKRGRPAGSRNRTKEDQVNLGEFADLIRDAHVILAGMATMPELMIDDNDAERLAKAAAKVIDHYELNRIVGVTTHPVVGLGRVAFAIYFPRIMAARFRRAAENAKPVQAAPAGLAPPAPAPKAPQPQQPPARPAAPPIATPPGAIRASPVPGFEHVTIDVPISKPN